MRFWFVATVCLAFGCSSKPDTLFTKVDPGHSGIDFKNWNTESEDGNILVYEYLYNGGGVALGDINNDGLVDIYFSSNSYENKLYLNKGNLEFEDITATSNTICEPGWKTGVSMVDINSDGWLDIYLCKSGDSDPNKRRNILLINNKDLTFTDQAKSYGLDDDSYSTQATFLDFDRDGDLDLFLLNHSLLQISNSFDITNKNSTQRYPFVGNKFYRNDSNHFVDVSDSVGVFGPASNYGLGVSVSDFNNDGWPDIYAGSDYTGRDRLLINDHGQRFVDSTSAMLSHISKFTMGTDATDINHDGFSDILTLDMLPEDNKRQKLLLGADKYNVFNQMVTSGLHYQYMRNMLHLNTGAGYFSEIGQLAGISNTDWSWAPLIADFDNDGNEDIFITNGFKRDLTNSDFAKYHAFQEMEKARAAGRTISKLEMIEKFDENKIHNYIFQGNEDLSFKNVVEAWGMSEPTLSNGAAYGDLDNDGDLDLVVSNVNDVAGVYENHSNTYRQNHFIEIALSGRISNTGATGACVRVYARGVEFMKEQFPVRGFQSSVGPVLHFGLGKNLQVDSLIIQWPDGRVQKQFKVMADQLLRIHEEDRLPMNHLSNRLPYFIKSEAPDFKHQENPFVDFDVQSLLPRAYSTTGPALAIGDVNGDDLNDVFVGGAKGQGGKVFVKGRNGKYTSMADQAFERDKNCEDVDALFFDADNDQDLDLYVVSGGYEFAANDPLLQDRLYLNDGRGYFTKSTLPTMFVSGGSVRASDIDHDGDLDLFVGGRIIPGRYPEAPDSYLLLNNGKGTFTIDQSNSFSKFGMVTDATWIDLNKDGFEDLVAVGEWMCPEIFLNTKGKLQRATEKFGTANLTGWWNSITKADLDNDGDDDLVLGNFGLNNQMRPSDSTPVSMVYGDFDANGSVDPIMSYYVMGKSYPFPSRDELLDQLPPWKKKFPNYASYANAMLRDVFSDDQLKGARQLNAGELRSICLRNDGHHFSVFPLPVEAQFAPVFSVAAMDVNDDKLLDLILVGNLSGTRSRTGKATGNVGTLLLNEGSFRFGALVPAKSGLMVKGDARHVVVDGNDMLIGVNGDYVGIYKTTIGNAKRYF